MTDNEMIQAVYRVKERCTPQECCCAFIARNALNTVGWDEDKAVKFLQEKHRLGYNFDINEFRRNNP